MRISGIKKNIRKYGKWIVFAMCILVFVHISVELSYKELIKLDEQIYSILAGMVSKKATKAFRFITRFGSVEVIFPLWILTLIIYKDKRKVMLSTLNLVCIFALNQSLKFMFARPRPAVVRLAEATGFSFPSGHSMISLGFYGFMLFLLLKSDYLRTVKVIATVAITGLVLMIGVSRIYLGVHYTTDVIAGFCLSMAYLIVFTDIIERTIYTEFRGNIFPTEPQ